MLTTIINHARICITQLNVICRRPLHSTCRVMAGGDWRLRQGMDPCGNGYGPLTDIPDWSYADGRPAPIRFKEKQRRQEREQVAKKIVQMIEDMNYGKEKTVEKKVEKEKIKQQIVNSKIRPMRRT